MYSVGDQAAPYKHYECSSILYVDAGGLQLPLAYTTPTPGTPLPTSKLFQGAEPACALAIEWYGVRERAKPEPPKLLVLGDFILIRAAAACHDVSKGTNGQDVVSASGYFLLATNVRPEHAVVPSLWTPYDGRYNTSVDQVAQYLYTPADLGIAELLPGADAQQTAGNPLLKITSTGGNKVFGVNP